MFVLREIERGQGFFEDFSKLRIHLASFFSVLKILKRHKYGFTQLLVFQFTMNLFGPFFGKQINFINLNSSVGLFTNKVNLVDAIVILALDLGGPGWVGL